MKKLLVIDGSLQGKDGNTTRLTHFLLAELQSKISIDYLELKACRNMVDEEQRFRAADGFVFTTGTYWQSWSSYAQRFFEEVTLWEGTDIWLGKPMCTLVTMHSVGGLEVLSRLQANFLLLGAFIPPMCGLVYSYVNHRAFAVPEKEHEGLDMWGLQDVPVVAHNLLEAINKTHNYRSWEVDVQTAAGRIWLK